MQGWTLQATSTDNHYPTIHADYPMEPVNDDLNTDIRNNNKYYYEVELRSCGSMRFGFCTNQTKDQTYRNRLGKDKFSWGFDGYKNILYHNKTRRPFFNESLIDERKKWKANDIIGVGLDLDKKIIEYWLNGEYMGIGFENVQITLFSHVFPWIILKKHK